MLFVKKRPSPSYRRNRWDFGRSKCLETRMRELTWDEFAGAAGTVFSIEDEEGRVELALDRVDELPSAGRAAGSFRLEFLGPLDPILPQAIYPLRNGEDLFEIFIVPIGRTAAGVSYEAVFS